MCRAALISGRVIVTRHGGSAGAWRRTSARDRISCSTGRHPSEARTRSIQDCSFPWLVAFGKPQRVSIVEPRETPDATVPRTLVGKFSVQ